MYNLKVNLPHYVKSIDTDTSVFNEDFVIGQKNRDSKSEYAKDKGETHKKDNVFNAKQLLLKSQMLAAKQREVNEIKEIRLLTNKIFEEIDNYSKQRLVYLKEIYSQISTLVMAIVEKIIHSKINADKSFIAQIVMNALESANNEQDIEVQVNPEDKKSLEKYWENILKTQDRLANIVLQENHGINMGGCIIKTPNGSIDAQIESQLSVIEKLLIKHYSGLVYEHGE